MNLSLGMHPGRSQAEPHLDLFLRRGNFKWKLAQEYVFVYIQECPGVRICGLEVPPFHELNFEHLSQRNVMYTNFIDNFPWLPE